MADNVNNEQWEAFLAALPYGAELLQSPLWRNISESEGKQTKFFAWLKDEKIAAITQIIEEKNIFGVFWYIPRGPVYAEAKSDTDLWPNILTNLKQEARKRNVVAIRYEPSNDSASENLYGRRVHDIQPKQTLMLDLSLELELILKAMQPKTRYNIRLAEKRGVLIEKGNLQDLNLFYRLLKITTKRDRFRGHSLAHYQKLIQSSNNIELYLAKKDGKVLAAGIFSFYGRRATYLHGASANYGREHMAPHLLQWRMIERAKNLGCLYYDFYGIDSKKWPGVSRFKYGFSGKKLIYAGTFVSVIDPYRYYPYRLAVKLRKILHI